MSNPMVPVSLIREVLTTLKQCEEDFDTTRRKAAKERREAGQTEHDLESMEFDSYLLGQSAGLVQAAGLLRTMVKEDLAEELAKRYLD